jgi:hypothetical protein
VKASSLVHLKRGGEGGIRTLPRGGEKVLADGLSQVNALRAFFLKIPITQTHWYEYFLHNQRAALLKVRLFLQAGERVIVINTP